MSVLPLRKQRQPRTEFGLKQIWEDGARLQGASTPVRCMQVGRQAAQGMLRAPLSVSLSALSIGVAFFLLTLLVLVAGQLGSILEAHSDGVRMNVYLTESISEPERRALEGVVRQIGGVAEVQFISRDTALELFLSRLSGESALLSELKGENPLPASYELTFRSGQVTPERLATIRAELVKRPGVDVVNYSDEILEKFGSVARLVERASAFGVVLAIVVVCFVVASTVQLALFAHRDELEVMRLVGATSSYIQAPYIIEGAMQGVVGSLLGVSSAFLLHTLVHSALADIDLIRVLLPNPEFLSVPLVLILLITGGLIGAAGSLVAARSFLRKV